MRIEVTDTRHETSSLRKYHILYPHHPECSCYIYVPAQLSPELLEDVLNDAWLEAPPSEDLAEAI